MDITKFEKKPIMGILRVNKLPDMEKLIGISLVAGLETLEITMNTPGAPELIKKAIRYGEKQIAIGAGTVLSLESLKSALDCGASFIVMPTLIEGVVNYCRKNKIPVFPGAFTPSEIQRAWESGATMVKLFPAKIAGPTYIQEIKGPFNDIKIMATGGVSSENIKDFFKAGASAVAFGASIFKPDLIETNQFEIIGANIKKLISNLPVF